MAVQTRLPEEGASGSISQRGRTVVGWQGVRCSLPPDWSVSGFSMDRDNGYLRIDGPAHTEMTVQIRWSNAAKPADGAPSLHKLVAPVFRRALRRPEPPVQRPDLRANLDRILKEAAKGAKKSKSAFDSSTKPERTEGARGERTAINFSWSGGGRGQGKIWYCSVCHRVLVAQVVTLARDTAQLNTVASQLFASLQDHSDTGFDLWALYDLELEAPTDFRLQSQKLLSGYLRLELGRRAERLIIDRWGLANVTLKRFTLAEWFASHALLSLRKAQHDQVEAASGHKALHYNKRTSLLHRLRNIGDARLSLRGLPARYDAVAWECEESNRLYALQSVTTEANAGLWKEVAARCVCH